MTGIQNHKAVAPSTMRDTIFWSDEINGMTINYLQIIFSFLSQVFKNVPLRGDGFTAVVNRLHIVIMQSTADKSHIKLAVFKATVYNSNLFHWLWILRVISY